MRVSHGAFQGLIAIIAIVGCFSLAGVQLILEGNAEIPAWATALVSAIVAFYFGARAATDSQENGYKHAMENHVYERRETAKEEK